eukprot:scaffold9207_cov84-Cyclotella_meneghiniana.AAC.5
MVCYYIGRSAFTYYHTIVRISVAIPSVCRSVLICKSAGAGNLERGEKREELLNELCFFSLEG